MSYIRKNYALEEDEFGLFVITVTGLCTADERAAIEADCTRRYSKVPLPNASGAILKSLDGSKPRIVEIEPSTLTGARYRCVKVAGACNPFARSQDAGTYSGLTVLRFRLVYQQISGVA